MPEESDATRAINAAASVLLAFFDSAAHQITEAILDRAPRSSRPTDDTVAATRAARTPPRHSLDLDAGEHHDQAAAFVATLAKEHTCVYSTRYCAWTDYPVRPNSVIRTRGTNA